MKTTALFAFLFLAPIVSAAPLTGVEVSFMNFKTVDPGAICSRLKGSDQESLANLKKFAKYEALHNARGGRENAKKILDCIEKSGLVRKSDK